MKEYTVKTKVMCDFTFGGKPKGIAVEVVKPGNGRNGDGLIKVKLTETSGAYKKGEIVEISSFKAVPLAQILPLRRGLFFTRLSTDYQWNKP